MQGTICIALPGMHILALLIAWSQAAAFGLVIQGDARGRTCF